jgi:hypothetical protein
MTARPRSPIVTRKTIAAQNGQATSAGSAPTAVCCAQRRRHLHLDGVHRTSRRRCRRQRARARPLRLFASCREKRPGMKPAEASLCCQVVSSAEDDFRPHISPPGLRCRDLFEHPIFGVPAAAELDGDLRADGPDAASAAGSFRAHGARADHDDGPGRSGWCGMTPSRVGASPVRCGRVGRSRIVMTARV